jgi:hypothetical protein
MRKSLLIIVLFILSLRGFTQDLPGEILDAVSSGNAATLSKYFNSSLELTILDKEGVYSRTQAEMIVKDFFAQNIPKEFKILHQGGKETSKYAIGSLLSGSNNFRVTIFYKTEASGIFIHQFRIENEYVE